MVLSSKQIDFQRPLSLSRLAGSWHVVQTRVNTGLPNYLSSSLFHRLNKIQVGRKTAFHHFFNGIMELEDVSSELEIEKRACALGKCYTLKRVSKL